MLRELDDIIENGKRNYPDSIILSIDYAKAFDTLSLKAVRKAMLFFGFGEVYCKWINILLAERTSCVRNGGYISDFFDMERGVRQGCPISPLLFILTLELLARDIRKNEKIKGLKLPGFERSIKIKMYADDATFFLKDLIDYREVLSRIKLFSYFSGLNLNKNKSNAMLIGDPSQKNQIKFGIRIVNSIKILGITFSNEKAARDIEINFEPKIEQLDRICSLWQKRNLTIMGKITILKSFGLPLFIYLMQSIGLDELYIKRINSIMFKFLWKSNYNQQQKVIERVKREHLFKSTDLGGLNMFNLTNMQYSFYLKWADKLITEDLFSWKTIPIICYSPIGGLSAFKSQVVAKQFKGIHLVKNHFWRTVLITWLNLKNEKPVKQACNISDPIFNNTAVTYKGSTLFIESCIAKSIVLIKDFMFHGELMTFEQFYAKFGSNAETHLTYNIIYNALKKIEIEINSSPYLFKELEVGSLSRKNYYNLIKCNDAVFLNKGLCDDLLIDQNNPDVWRLLFDCTYEVKLIILQWKLMHGIYPTGTLLYKMKKRPTEMCEFCDERDTVIHFFVNCPVARNVWKEAEKVIVQLTSKTIHLSDKVIMTGLPSHEATLSKKELNKLNYICLIGKHTISKYRFERKGKANFLFERELWIRNIK